MPPQANPLIVATLLEQNQIIANLNCFKFLSLTATRSSVLMIHFVICDDSCNSICALSVLFSALCNEIPQQQTGRSLVLLNIRILFLTLHRMDFSFILHVKKEYADVQKPQNVFMSSKEKSLHARTTALPLN